MLNVHKSRKNLNSLFQVLQTSITNILTLIAIFPIKTGEYVKKTIIMKSQYIVFHSATKNYFLNIFRSNFFSPFTVLTRSQTCQFIGDNSKYGLRRANAEYVKELCTIGFWMRTLTEKRSPRTPEEGRTKGAPTYSRT